MAERACELTGGSDPEKLKTLAAAYAETGRFDAAVEAVQKAQRKAAAAERTGLAEQCQKMAESFSASKSWREKD